MTPINEKTCAHCGQTFTRKKGVPYERFAARKTCSRLCRGRYIHATHGTITAAAAEWKRLYATDPSFRDGHLSRATDTIIRVQPRSTEKAVGWCPPERLSEYRSLIRRNGIPSTEARAIIEADIGKQEFRHHQRAMAERHARQQRDAY